MGSNLGGVGGGSGQNVNMDQLLAALSGPGGVATKAAVDSLSAQNMQTLVSLLEGKYAPNNPNPAAPGTVSDSDMQGSLAFLQNLNADQISQLEGLLQAGSGGALLPNVVDQKLETLYNTTDLSSFTSGLSDLISTLQGLPASQQNDATAALLGKLQQIQQDAAQPNADLSTLHGELNNAMPTPLLVAAQLNDWKNATSPDAKAAIQTQMETELKNASGQDALEFAIAFRTAGMAIKQKADAETSALQQIMSFAQNAMQGMTNDQQMTFLQNLKNTMNSFSSPPTSDDIAKLQTLLDPTNSNPQLAAWFKATPMTTLAVVIAQMQKELNREQLVSTDLAVKQFQTIQEATNAWCQERQASADAEIEYDKTMQNLAWGQIGLAVGSLAVGDLTTRYAANKGVTGQGLSTAFSTANQSTHEIGQAFMDQVKYAADATKAGKQSVADQVMKQVDTFLQGAHQWYQNQNSTAQSLRDAFTKMTDMLKQIIEENLRAMTLHI